jgi:hypothetical protein
VVFVHGGSATDRRVKELVLEVRLERDINRCKAGTQNNWTYRTMHDAKIISDDDNVNMGNHSTRKSTFLWGIIGDGELELVKEVGSRSVKTNIGHPVSKSKFRTLVKVNLGRRTSR